jgi:hypothetical protein
MRCLYHDNVLSAAYVTSRTGHARWCVGNTMVHTHKVVVGSSHHDGRRYDASHYKVIFANSPMLRSDPA